MRGCGPIVSRAEIRLSRPPSPERAPIRSSRIAFLAAVSSAAVNPSFNVRVSSSMKLASTFGVFDGLAMAEAENAAASPSTGAMKFDPTL